MLIVRPIQESDYEALNLCAVESGHGFTSLPVNEELLKKRIHHSIESFEKSGLSEPGGEGYLMVGVDADTGEVAGTTAIESSVGWDIPFYSYHIGSVVHASHELGVKNTVKILTLGNNYTGCTEVCTLFLRPQFRGGLNGKLMSKCRFLFMAEYRERFAKLVIAEMRGVSNQEGKSPFWQWLQENFFSIDFTAADYLMGIGKKDFVTDLMPKLPIYVNLLSKEAQKVIGQVHEKTVPALKLIQKEGFVCRDYVDIFDAGPTVECDLHNIESIRNSFHAKVTIGEHTSEKDYLMTNTSCEHFRAVATQAALEASQEQDSRTVILAPKVAAALDVDEGDFIRMLVM